MQGHDGHGEATTNTTGRLKWVVRCASLGELRDPAYTMCGLFSHNCIHIDEEAIIRQFGRGLPCAEK